jgi:hypothetical protein
MKQSHWRGNDHVWDDQEDGAYRRYQRICKGRPGDKKSDFPRLWRRQQECDCDIEASISVRYSEKSRWRKMTMYQHAE